VTETHHPLAVAPSTAGPLAGKTVLLVEDEVFIAELLVSWLARLGVQTLWANNGQEAVRLLGENTDRVCVVIADFRLPDMDGDAMCGRLREIKPRLPVLLSSGRYQREAAESLARSGPTCFIQKPYPLEDVFEKLQKLLSVI
jgi:two-component system cell cycle sensor histidine kinase/response regulator CckA